MTDNQNTDSGDAAKTPLANVPEETELEECLREENESLRAELGQVYARELRHNKLPSEQAGEGELLPCPWCGALSDEEDEWGSLITHKPTCYWLNIHGDSIGRVRVNNSEKAAWNTRASQPQANLGNDQPWSLRDVLFILADAAVHQGQVHNCDCHGWEETQGVIPLARQYAAELSQPQATRSRCTCNHVCPPRIEFEIDEDTHCVHAPDCELIKSAAHPVEQREDEVSKALTELREMFEPGNTLLIGCTVQVGFRSWSGTTLSEVMQKVRQWKEQQKWVG